MSEFGGRFFQRRWFQELGDDANKKLNVRTRAGWQCQWWADPKNKFTSNKRTDSNVDFYKNIFKKPTVSLLF